MTRWRLQDDVLLFEECLRLRLHRLGLSHWRAAGALRSWGAVPLHREGNTLHAPCANDEALWLGAWLDDDTAARAEVELLHPASGHSARLMAPDGFQIASLAGPDGTRHPIVHADASLSMTIRCGAASATMALRFHAPTDWAAISGRAAPEPLAAPPPLPPRLG